MKKILFLINLLLLSASLQAMNVPQTKVAVEKKVRLLFGEQEGSLEIPLEHARLIKGFQVLFDPVIFRDIEKSFPLPEVALEVGRLIVAQLGRVYAYSHQSNNKALDAIKDDFKKLDGNTLVRILRAVDYLDIPVLLKIALDEVKARKSETISTSELASLRSGLRSPLIRDKVAALFGIEFSKKSSAPAASSEEEIELDLSDKRLPVISALVGWQPEAEATVISVCVTADNKIVSGSNDNTIRIWDMQGNQLAVCKGHENFVSSVCVTLDNKIVSGSHDKTVRLWDMQGNQLGVCRGHEGSVYSVCLTGDNKIVSGLDDNTIRICDMEGNQLALCDGHKDEVRSVCVTSDNKIVSGSLDKTIRIWNMQGKELAICRGHESGVESVCVTLDNKIVSGSHDKTVRLWDMQGNQLAVCKGHKHGVWSVRVTSDNKIVSGSQDKTIRIWDMQGNQLGACRGHEDWVTTVNVTGDNKIVSGSSDHTIKIWDLEKLLVLEGTSRASYTSQQKTEEILAVLNAYDAGIKDAEVCFNELKNIVSNTI